jgi:serine/threonine-protein phosphatase 2A catalytic subunit
MNNMDTNMEDVKMPELQQMPQSPIEPTTTATLDSWIGGLLDCKQLAEKDVQRLCEKVEYFAAEDGYFCFERANRNLGA